MQVPHRLCSTARYGTWLGELRRAPASAGRGDTGGAPPGGGGSVADHDAAAFGFDTAGMKQWAQGAPAEALVHKVTSQLFVAAAGRACIMALEVDRRARCLRVSELWSHICSARTRGVSRR
jgi:hypothetical protein